MNGEIGSAPLRSAHGAGEPRISPARPMRNLAQVQDAGTRLQARHRDGCRGVPEWGAERPQAGSAAFLRPFALGAASEASAALRGRPRVLGASEAVSPVSAALGATFRRC